MPKEEVGSFTPEHEIEGPKRSRIRCILLCVTLITLLGLIIVLAIIFSYGSESPGLIVYPTNEIFLESWTTSKEAQEYKDALDTFANSFDNYNNFPGEHIRDCRTGDKGGNCKFDPIWFKSPCHNSEEWGFKEWHPCIVLTFKGPPDWIPEPYEYPEELPEGMPESLRDAIIVGLSEQPPKQMLWVSCGGEHPADREYMGEPILSPWPGFPTYYFPLRHNTSQLATPALALQVPGTETNILVNIKCYFWAKNLEPPYVAASIEYLIT